MTQNTTTTKGLRQLDPEALSGSVESLFPGQLAGSLQRLTQDDLMKLIELADAVYPDPTKVYKSNTVRVPGSPGGLSKCQAKILDNQLKKHGYPTLNSYLRSDHWKELKELYRATVHLTGEDAGYWKQGLPQTCVVCQDPNVDLHHRTYKRLGEEQLTDLVPLCRRHHDQLHDEGLDLWHGPKILYDREMKRRNQSLNRPLSTPT